MALPIHDVVKMIDAELASRPNPERNSILDMRMRRLSFARDFLLKHGYPRTRRERFELSLHPYYFQEANYDDLDPYTRTGSLGHLRNIYEIDLAIHSGGFTRADISDSAFARYRKDQAGIIPWRQGHAKLRDKVLLLFSSMRA